MGLRVEGGLYLIRFYFKRGSGKFTFRMGCKCYKCRGMVRSGLIETMLIIDKYVSRTLFCCCYVYIIVKGVLVVTFNSFSCIHYF